MVKFALLQVSESDGYGEMVRFAHNVLLEIHLLYEVVMVQLNVFKNAKVLLACNSDCHPLEAILLALQLGLHLLAPQHDVDLLVFVLGVGEDDAWTLPLLLKFDDQVGGLSLLGEDDVFVLVEHCLVEEAPPGGFDGELRLVDGHEVGDVAPVLVAGEQTLPADRGTQLEHN